MRVPSPIGEVVDRITITRIKADRLQLPHARDAAISYLLSLTEVWRDAALPPIDSLPETAELTTVNEELWEVEDRLRACEQRQDFGEAFVADARAVYRLNDRRAALKASLDARLDSELSDPKSYASKVVGSASDATIP